MKVKPTDYVPAPVATVQCPRCGQTLDLREVHREVGMLEYAGVCGTPLRDAGYCSTTLRLSAAAHVFAAS